MRSASDGREADYYDVLGVPRDAADAEIKRAFRRLAQHITRTSTRRTAPRSASRRSTRRTASCPTGSGGQAYDMFGHAGVDGGGGGRLQASAADSAPLATSSTRSSAAPPAGARRAGGVVPGADLRYDLTMTFAEAIFGVTKEISFPRSCPASAATESGGEPGTEPQTCPECNGTGEMRPRRSDDPRPDGQHLRLRPLQRRGPDHRHALHRLRRRWPRREERSLEVDDAGRHRRWPADRARGPG